MNIKRILEDHKKWLLWEGGERADLQDANLRGANLRGADLQDANLQDADLQDANLRDADLQDANLRGADLQDANLRDANLQDADLQDANLRGADLQDADLRGADLQDANFDFSCFPLWCGGSKFKCSEKLVQQLCAHICTLEIVDASEDIKKAIKAIKSEALKSHRADDLGLKEGDK